MKLEIRNNKDFWAGMMFLVIGAVAMFVARDYPFGTTLHMGPGYLPSVLSGILILFSIYIIVRGLRTGEKFKVNWPVRALIVLPLSLLLFGVLMAYVGFIPAMAVLVIGSAASDRKFKIFEVLLLTVFLTVLTVAVFIWGLGLPYPLIKGF